MQSQQLSCDGEDSSGQRRPRNPLQDEVTSCPLVQWPWDILSLSRQIASSEKCQLQTVGGRKRDIKVDGQVACLSCAGPEFTSQHPVRWLTTSCNSSAFGALGTRDAHSRQTLTHIK